MSFKIYLAAISFLLFGCGKNTVLHSTPEQAPLTKQAVSQSQIHLVATVLENGLPVPNIEIQISRTVSGQPLDFLWSGRTDARGKTTIKIQSPSGYYIAQTKSDKISGRWHSLPLQAKHEVHLTLPLNKRASSTYTIPLPKTRTFSLPGGATLEMVWVEPGTFLMGSPLNELGQKEDESPQRTVTLTRGFYISRHEITRKQWQSVMGQQPWESSRPTQGDFYPADFITKNNISSFLETINLASMGTAHFRLPTEAQWEYAARAGTTTPWSFGNTPQKLSDFAWFNENTKQIGNAYPHPVGTKLPNAWGIYDMHGNMLELVSDWYRPYADIQAHVIDPTGPETGVHADHGAPSRQVLRGGHFESPSQSVRSAARSFDTGNNSSRQSNRGFRLVATTP